MLDFSFFDTAHTVRMRALKIFDIHQTLKYLQIYAHVYYK